MKTRSTTAIHIFLLKAILISGVACLAQYARATPPPTFWTGPVTNYTEPAAKAADVLLSGKVSIARNSRQWLYNTNTESGPTTTSPTDTEWAFGPLDNNATNLTYQTFASFRDGDLQGVLVTTPPSPMVCHLINENIYLSVTFTVWTASDRVGTGFFAYTRSTPAVAPPTPTVSITNPAPNSVFAAPANVAIGASASVSSGAVTNVSFFGNGSLLGSSQASPFGITATGLAAGSNALTAVATASGVSATSSVVNISVVTPVVTSLSSPSVGTGNQFVFSYNVNPGLRYVVEDSADLPTFTPLVTNVPASSPAFFTNPISGSHNFFRVGRMPNP